MHALQVGDFAPRFIFDDSKGGKFDLYADSVSGRIIVLVFYQNYSFAESLLREFAALSDEFRKLDASIIAVGLEGSDCGQAVGGKDRPFTSISNAPAELFNAYGVNLGPESPLSPATSIVIRPNGHVLDILNVRDQASQTLNIAREFHKNMSRPTIADHPPVLILPDVLSPSDCKDLITAYENSDAPFVELEELWNQESDVKCRIPDYGREDRIDLRLNSHEVLELVVSRLQKRLLPEIKKAFHYEATLLEGVRVARYEGVRGGKSHGHRDNSTDGTAHRKFAVSINLNSADFEGGGLRFPEFSPRRYNPETGAAIVFSCSLLHEALEVRKGSRYVLLAFLVCNR